MSADGIVHLAKLVVNPRARTLSTGEKVAGISFVLRFTGAIHLSIFALMARIRFRSEPHDEWEPWIMSAIVVLVTVFLLILWRYKLRWSGDVLGIRGVFRGWRSYEWEDVKALSGSRDSWTMEMCDGRTFKGSAWTSGGQEFLELLREKSGGRFPGF